jgi:hypothetical protein
VRKYWNLVLSSRFGVCIICEESGGFIVHRKIDECIHIVDKSEEHINGRSCAYSSRRDSV